MNAFSFSFSPPPQKNEWGIISDIYYCIYYCSEKICFAICRVQNFYFTLLSEELLNAKLSSAENFASSRSEINFQQFFRLRKRQINFMQR